MYNLLDCHLQHSYIDIKIQGEQLAKAKFTYVRAMSPSFPLPTYVNKTIVGQLKHHLYI